MTDTTMTDTTMTTTSNNDYADQVVIVTGAAQGIGLATAEVLAHCGAHVVLTDIDETKLVAATDKLVANGLDVSRHTADLADEAAVTELVDTVITRHGQIDVLINLAAIYPFIPFDELTLDDWHKIVHTNLDSTFLCTRAVLPHMRARRYGRIVNTASGTFANPAPGLSAYVASKGAVIGFSRQLTREVGEGITVNIVMPGLIATDHTLTMLDDKTATDAFFEAVGEQQSVRRRGEARDVAYTIAHIAHPESGFITGQIFDVGGGATFH